MGVSAVVEPGLAVQSTVEMGTEHSPLLEQQEDDIKVRSREGTEVI